jgi:uncharacterized protein YbaA (DUF1428 family)
MAYFSFYMAPIKIADIPAYRESGREAGEVFRSLGAIELIEYWSDDHPNPDLKSVAQNLKCLPDEVVVFGWSVWPSKEALDACNAELQSRPRQLSSTANFDVSRMVVGNFRAEPPDLSADRLSSPAI